MDNTPSFRFLIKLTLSVILLSIFSGCDSSTSWGSSGKGLQSQLPRNMHPEVLPEESKNLVSGNSKLAFDLYWSLREKDGNLFYSPFSISMALAMTYAGARENTETQMAQTLHYTLPQERLHPAFNALDLKLSSLSEGGSDSEKQPFQLNITNSLWGQQGHPFLTEFLDLLSQNYGAGLRLLDFAGEPEAARNAINDWVEEQTRNKIKNIIPEGGVDTNTRLALANAIYFKADWSFPFEKNNTRDMPFYLLDGTVINVPMMSYDRSESLGYAAGEDYQVVELPYVGDAASMIILVPDSGKFQQFEAKLDAPFVESVLESMESRQVTLTMPKFRFESEFELKRTLASLGMPDAFDAARADFSGIDGERNLFIGNIFHKAFVAVDEKGTEAAAATVVVMVESAMPFQDVILVVDRPFIFLIRERSTGSILFVGRVLDPS